MKLWRRLLDVFEHRPTGQDDERSRKGRQLDRMQIEVDISAKTAKADKVIAHARLDSYRRIHIHR